MKNSSSFFRNVDCEYFPCHKGKDIENFNCLMCFCPLYADENCGGASVYLENGVKDCSNCIFPHVAENYSKIIKKCQSKIISKNIVSKQD